jgi:hypothetical protein
MTQVTAADILEECAKTFRERGVAYKDNVQRVGKALAAFFPEGLDLRSAEDQERFQIFVMVVVKLSRYAVNFAKGHQDSIRDLTVYGAILEAIDARLATPLASPPEVANEFANESGEPSAPPAAAERLRNDMAAAQRRFTTHDGTHIAQQLEKGDKVRFLRGDRISVYEVDAIEGSEAHLLSPVTDSGVLIPVGKYPTNLLERVPPCWELRHVC